MVRFYQVLPRLYARGRFDQWPRERKLRELQARNITSVVSMIAKRDPDVAKAYFPMADGKRVDELMLSAAVSYVLQRLAAGETVLVHCRAGKNRTGLVLALVVAKTLRLSGRAAISHVRRCVSHAIHNPVFERYITSVVDEEELSKDGV